MQISIVSSCRRAWSSSHKIPAVARLVSIVTRCLSRHDGAAVVAIVASLLLLLLLWPGPAFRTDLVTVRFVNIAPLLPLLLLLYFSGEHCCYCCYLLLLWVGSEAMMMMLWHFSGRRSMRRAVKVSTRYVLVVAPDQIWHWLVWNNSKALNLQYKDPAMLKDDDDDDWLFVCDDGRGAIAVCWGRQDIGGLPFLHWYYY
jgi:hypothetical protein